MGNRSAVFSDNIPGGPQNIIDVKTHPDEVFFVDSSNTNASDSVGYGNTPDIPLASIDYVFNLATTNKNTIAYIMPGHTESYNTTGTKMTGDKNGVKIIGLGTGSNRPTITFSHTGATWSITSNNISISNILFVTGVDSVTTFGTISGSDCKLINCETRDTTDIEVVDAFKITGDRFEAFKHFHNGYASGNANARVFSLNGVESATFDACTFYTKVTTAVIDMITAASNNVIVKNSSFFVSGTTDFSKSVVDTVTGSTWEVTNCFDIAAGSLFSGGSGAALAATDTTGLAAAIAVIDGFHDVPSADSANNSQVRDVVGNKTDTANATGSLVRMAKHIISLIGTPAGADTATDIAAIKTVVDTISGYVDTEISVIDAFHDVPSQNTANNNQMRDVVGNKTDTTAGDSIISLLKAIKAVTDVIPDSGALTTIDGFHDVPSADSADNNQMRDAVGNKTDTVAGNSIIALLKQIIVDLTSAVTQPPTAKSLHDTLHKDGSYTFDNTTDSLEAIADSIIGAVNEPPTAKSLHDILHKDGSYTYDNTTDSLEAIADNTSAIINDITAAVDEPPTAKSLHDILHKDGSYTFDNTTDSLEAISDLVTTADTAIDNVAADLGDFSGRTNLQTALAVLGNPDAAGATTHSTIVGTNYSYNAKLGTKVAKAKADLLDGVQNELFTISGGKVHVTHIVLEICDNAVDAEAVNTKIILDPDVGADVDLCAVGNLNAAAVGTLCTITGTLSDALQFSNGVAPQMATGGITLAEGSIDILNTSGDGADGGATVSAELYYIVVDSGASVSSA